MFASVASCLVVVACRITVPGLGVRSAGMMERCIAAHQVTRDRAGKCGNAGARCYAHTMLDMLSISADKGKGSADET